MAAVHLVERVMRSAFYVVVLIAIIWSLRTIEIIPEFLYDAPQQTVDLFARMWPIDWGWYPKVVQPRIDRDAAHRDARHDPGGRLCELGCAHGGAQHHTLGHHQYDRPLHSGGDALGSCDHLGTVLRRGVWAGRSRRHPGDRRAFDRLHREIPFGSRSKRPRPGRSRRWSPPAHRQLQSCSRVIGHRSSRRSFRSPCSVGT